MIKEIIGGLLWQVHQKSGSMDRRLLLCITELLQMPRDHSGIFCKKLLDSTHSFERKQLKKQPEKVIDSQIKDNINFLAVLSEIIAYRFFRQGGYNIQVDDGNQKCDFVLTKPTGEIRCDVFSQRFMVDNDRTREYYDDASLETFKIQQTVIKKRRDGQVFDTIWVEIQSTPFGYAGDYLESIKNSLDVKKLQLDRILLVGLALDEIYEIT